MARWSIPIPVLDPLYDRQVLAWREAFDFGRSSEREPAAGPPLRPWDLTHADARSRPRQAPPRASRDGRSKRAT